MKFGIFTVKNKSFFLETLYSVDFSKCEKDVTTSLQAQLLLRIGYR